MKNVSNNQAISLIAVISMWTPCLFGLTLAIFQFLNLIIRYSCGYSIPRLNLKNELMVRCERLLNAHSNLVDFECQIINLIGNHVVNDDSDCRCTNTHTCVDKCLSNTY